MSEYATILVSEIHLQGIIIIRFRAWICGQETATFNGVTWGHGAIYKLSYYYYYYRQI